MPPRLFDTHAHVQLPRFARDREGVIARAAAAGVSRILVVGFDLESTRGAIALSEAYPEMCRATVGLHPHDAQRWNDEVAAELRDLAAHPQVVAMGEAGLDYYRDLSPRDRQLDAFVGQIELALDLDLPLVIHNRDATDDVFDVLKRYGGNVRALLHCFVGDRETAQRALELGCRFGIGGPVTYPKSGPLRDAVAWLPPGSFMVETDAPWLAPQDRRGKRNEPAFVRATAQRVAEVRGVRFEEIAAETTANAERLFRLAEPEC